MSAWRAVKRGLGKTLGVLMIAMVRLYQYTLSPLLGPRCRFWPSCSSYTIEAIQVHGPLKGGWMGFKRIVKCHPGHPGGMDPVPGGRSEALCREDEAGRDHTRAGKAPADTTPRRCDHTD